MMRNVLRRSAAALSVTALVLLAMLLVSPVSAAARVSSTTTTTDASSSSQLNPGSTSTSLPGSPSSSGDSGAAKAKEPAIHGRAAILIDAADGRILYSRNANQRLAIASTTKIMTGILALESLELDQRVTASAEACATGESEMWLEPGEQIRVEDLMYGLMVKSGNDAAVVLAEASAGTVKAFVAKMNAKAAELGMKNTHFSNPHGLDYKSFLDEQGHYSSAFDMATLARYAMQNPDFRRFVGTKEVDVPWPGHPSPRHMENHNVLLRRAAFVTGVKTGFTAKAGFCLVSSGRSRGVDLIAVILGEKDKNRLWTESEKLLRYGYSKYKDLTLVEGGVKMAQLDVPYHYGEKMDLVTERKVTRTVHEDDQLTSDMSVVSSIEAPVATGAVLGQIVYKVQGKQVEQVNLVASRAIERPTLRVKIAYYWDRFKGFLGDLF